MPDEPVNAWALAMRDVVGPGEPPAEVTPAIDPELLARIAAFLDGLENS